MQLSAAGTLGMLAVGPLGCATGAVDRKSYGVGLQLYSVRDAMEADVPGTLKKISEMGYKYPELASYADGKFYGYAPKAFRKMVEDLGMEVISSHTQVEAAGITLDNAKIMAEAHAELGAKYCVQPWVEEVDRHVEFYTKMVDVWNEVGSIMKEVGIQFGYHNHNFEFDNLDGVVPYYDILLKGFDPELVTMEIDFFWASKAGQDPVETFEKYPGRFQLFHMKDMKTHEEPFFDVIKDDICPVGAGVIDFKRFLDAREKAGMKYLFVEDDNQGNGDAFGSAETSIRNLCTDILV
jgi:sugar phosphate isomerase/epimerase